MTDTTPEFEISGIDSIIRPFNAEVTGHDTSIATIVLLQNGATRVPSDQYSGMSSGNIGNWMNFKSYITTLISDPGMTEQELSGVREGSYIANLIDSKGYQGLDGTNPYYGVFNNFSLVGVTEQNSAIVKIHQNFSGYWNAFFFGQAPRVYTFTGMFLDTKEYPYYQEFLTAYDRYLSGEKCVANNMTMKIMYDGRIADGYMINVATNNSADQPYMKQFTFSVLIRGAAWVRSNHVYKKNQDGDVELEKVGLNAMSNQARFDRDAMYGYLGGSETSRMVASKIGQ